MPESLRDTIARVAREEGLDPSYALAVAERESSFNPNAGGTGTIRGLFQMTRAARRQVGLPEDASAEDQVRGFARFTKNVQGEMRGVMGRDPTPEESYLGHHFGGVRAGRVVQGHYNGYAPGEVFSPREMAGNPHFGRAASMDQLAGSITRDMSRRRAKFGGESGTAAETDFAQFGHPLEGQPDNTTAESGGKADMDFASFGQPHQDQATALPKPQPELVAQNASSPEFAQFGQPQDVPQKTASNDTPTLGSPPLIKPPKADLRPGTEIDLSQFGKTADQEKKPAQTNPLGLLAAALAAKPAASAAAEPQPQAPVPEVLPDPGLAQRALLASYAAPIPGIPAIPAIPMSPLPTQPRFGLA